MQAARQLISGQATARVDRGPYDHGTILCIKLQLCTSRGIRGKVCDLCVFCCVLLSERPGMRDAQLTPRFRLSDQGQHQHGQGDHDSTAVSARCL